jgi:hypothetical protein
MESIGQRLRLDQPATYQIRVQGRLDESWSAWFDNMTITVENHENGAAVTTLTGTVTDQVALHGLLSRIRDLGLPLLLVQCTGQVNQASTIEGGKGNE